MIKPTIKTRAEIVDGERAIARPTIGGGAYAAPGEEQHAVLYLEIELPDLAGYIRDQIGDFTLDQDERPQITFRDGKFCLSLCAVSREPIREA